jgi:formylglycine-generating enzyme required for sulfatase activity
MTHAFAVMRPWALACLFAIPTVISTGCSGGAEVAASDESLASVHPLLERTVYATLDRDAVDALRLAAEGIAEWRAILTEEFTFAGIARHESVVVSHWIAMYRHNVTGLEFALIPGGTFQAGSPQGEKNREADEELHTVTIARPFLIARTEVTEAQWRKVPDARPMDRYGDPERFPVAMVTWDEAAAWCMRLKCVLPTGDQWEYACRAGTQTRFHSGDAPRDLDDVAWIAQNAEKHAHPVGAKPANAFGLVDMHGNVAEYCAAVDTDWSGGVFDPVWGSSELKEIRGGGYDSTVQTCRAAFRLKGPTNQPVEWVGFRPVRLLP